MDEATKHTNIISTPTDGNIEEDNNTITCLMHRKLENHNQYFNQYWMKHDTIPFQSNKFTSNKD